jgi:hypothetical protein
MGTGLALMVDPAIVVTLLLAMDTSGVGIVLGRCFGVALLALGAACWPSREGADSGSAAVRGMSIYNGLIALYLAGLGTIGHVGGVLLWPAVALHAIVALLLVSTRRAGRRNKVSVR